MTIHFFSPIQTAQMHSPGVWMAGRRRGRSFFKNQPEDFFFLSTFESKERNSVEECKKVPFPASRSASPRVFERSQNLFESGSKEKNDE
jgi:hypothetical protein